MAFDEDEDGLDDDHIAPLLPPDDRLWRHPSELFGGHQHRSGREPRLLTVAGLSATISVLLTLGLVTVVRPLRTTVNEVGGEPVSAAAITPTGSISGVADVAALAERLRPVIAQVEAAKADGPVRGSGVLLRGDGMVVTTKGLVDGTAAVQVLLHDGRRLPATVVGSDPETDLAVIKVDGGAMPTAVLGSAVALRVGSPAITVGSPAGESGGPVVTVGVVSALGQQISRGTASLVDMIQVDGSLAPGCEGAAVVDSAGRVIGIAAGNWRENDTAPSVGYATPIDIARQVAAQLMTTGRVVRGWLGVEGATVSKAQATDLGVDSGAVVQRVKPGSPAAAAGVATGDVITAVDGESIASMTTLAVELRSRRPGDIVKLAIRRGKDAMEVAATLAEKPPSN